MSGGLNEWRSNGRYNRFGLVRRHRSASTTTTLATSATQDRTLAVFNYEGAENVYTFPQMCKYVYRRATRPIRHWFQAPRFYQEVVTGLNVTEETLARLDELDSGDEDEKCGKSENVPIPQEDSGSSPDEPGTAIVPMNYRFAPPDLIEPPVAERRTRAQRNANRRNKRAELREELMLEIANEVKAKFGGTPERTAANDQVAREYAYRVMARIKDLRYTEMELMAPRVMANIFCPSQQELKTEIMMQKSGINKRNATLFKYRPRRN